MKLLTKVQVVEHTEKYTEGLFTYEIKRKVEITSHLFRPDIERTISAEIVYGRVDGRDLRACSCRGLETLVSRLRNIKEGLGEIPISSLILRKQ